MCFLVWRIASGLRYMRQDLRGFSVRGPFFVGFLVSLLWYFRFLSTRGRAWALLARMTLFSNTLFVFEQFLKRYYVVINFDVYTSLLSSEDVMAFYGVRPSQTLCVIGAFSSVFALLSTIFSKKLSRHPHAPTSSTDSYEYQLKTYLEAFIIR